MYKNMKEFGKAWVKALRSGEYKQGSNTLLREGTEYDRFCCLGVAADLLVLDNPKYKWDGGEHFVGPDSSSASRISYVSPAWLRKWLNEVDSEGLGYRESRLISLNDVGKYSFKRIADYIEKELKNGK